MKKNLSLLAIVMLAICLAAFAFDRMIPASAVQAASETSQVSSSAGPSEKESAPQAAPLPRSTRPVVFIVTGLVCILFGILAVSPLLVDDPRRLLEEANSGERTAADW